MDQIMRDLTAIGSAIVGLAIITVLVRQGSQTSQVIGASAGGFAQVLNAAMGVGGNAGGYSGTAF